MHFAHRWSAKRNCWGREVTIIGFDLAKNVFRVHAAAADGAVLFRKKLSGPQFIRFAASRN